MRPILVAAALVFGLPLLLIVLASTDGVGWLLPLILVELFFAKLQISSTRGLAATFYNRKGVRRLERGDAGGAAAAFARALWFGRGMTAYVNNLALALVYTGDLDGARRAIEPAIEAPGLKEPMRGVLMSTWALLLALQGEVEQARVAEEAAFKQDFSLASWVIAARERRWPFTKPEQLKGAWARHLYDVLEAYVAGQGYRDQALDRPLPIGLARALAYQWPEMKVFLGG